MDTKKAVLDGLDCGYLNPRRGGCQCGFLTRTAKLALLVTTTHKDYNLYNHNV
ncbi:hypothetical protein [Glaesserella parasuis]|uniref:hypothetical protein n=1 Tax=Glaesserella parasuis TaxID=738 RepID=UPI003B66E78D